MSGRGILEYERYRTERVGFATPTSDPANPAAGEAWLRLDLADAPNDKYGEFRFYDGSGVRSVDVIAPGTGDAPVEEPLRVQTPNGVGVVKAAARAEATYPEFSLQHNGSPLGLGYAAIPDSEANQKLVHRWILDDVGTGTATDSEGSADGTVNGVSNVNGDWAGGSAGDGDGTDDYIETTTLGSYGADLSSDFAVAFSMRLTSISSSAAFFGTSDAGETGLILQSGFTSGGTPGDIEFFLRDDDGDQLRAYTDNTYDNDTQYRVVLNKKGNAVADIDVYANQSTISTSTNADENFDSTSNFSHPMAFFARNVGGSIGDHMPVILDDICFFNDSLTDSEAKSYQNPWS